MIDAQKPERISLQLPDNSYTYVHDIIDQIIKQGHSIPGFISETAEALKGLQRLCEQRHVVHAVQFLSLPTNDFRQKGISYSHRRTPVVKKGEYRRITTPYSQTMFVGGAIKDNLEPGLAHVKFDPEALGASTIRFSQGEVIHKFPENPVEAIRTIESAYKKIGVPNRRPFGFMSKAVDRKYPASRYFEGTISSEFYERHRAEFEKMGLKRGKQKFSEDLMASAEIRYELARLFEHAVLDVTRKVLLKQDWRVVSNPGPTPFILRPTYEGLEALNEFAPNERTDEILARIVELGSDPAWGENFIEVLCRYRSDMDERPAPAAS